MNFSLTDFQGMRITIMGLGLHGGGMASARFFAQQGAKVTVTDLRSREVLKPSLEQLAPYPIRYVLGKHEEADFSQADLVIKNPAVPKASPFLKLAKQVETDISVFLRLNKNPLIAITGSKGKSTTASALYHVLKQEFPGAQLGGNITVSPLTFLNHLADKKIPVVLELSSWQLGDIKGKNLLRPQIAIITNIFPDHQNFYTSMDHYVADKRVIYSCQTQEQYTLCNYDDQFGRGFAEETKGKVFYFSRHPLPPSLDGAWMEQSEGILRTEGTQITILPSALKVIGEHNRLNCLIAASALSLYGLDKEVIMKGLETFPGIPHRMEFLRTVKGVHFYNDSAATIPQAVAEALKSFQAPIHLIIGGSDKQLDFSFLEQYLLIPKNIILLEGNAAPKIIQVLGKLKRSFQGPFSHLKTAVESAYHSARGGEIVVLSPGCASFGMFKNEFDRGDQFRTIVGELTE